MMIQVKSNLSQVLAAMARAKKEGLEVSASFIEEKAKALAPVKSGALRDSIASEVGEDKATIGAQADYAPFVELGTRHMKSQPFLTPAALDNLSALEDQIQSKFRLG